jgi:hypothetical protein
MPNPIAMQTVHSHTTPVISGNANQTGIAPINSLVTYNLAPGALIPDKMKQAIWSNEFVELHSLLKTQPEEMTLTLNANNELVMMPKSSPKAMSINSWISAFTIYMDIYVQAHPNEFSPLLTYMNIIRDLDRGYGQAAFNFYDRSFRSHRQTKQLPWGTIHYELWVKSTSLPIRTQNNDSFTQNTSKRYCYDFNKRKGCTKRFCQYAHICGNCRKNHPSYKCFGLQTSQYNTKAASPRPLSTSAPSQSNVIKQHSFRNNPNKK